MERTPTPRGFARLLCFVSLAGTWLGAGCGGGSPEQEARAAFERFQDALFASDRAALATTLSRTSLAALADLPLERARGKQRLIPTRVRAAPPEYLIDVRDPNENDKRSTFVVTREDGRYVVDLVGTAGQHQVADPNAKREWRIEPGTVDRRDVERAAAALERGERGGARGVPAAARR